MTALSSGLICRCLSRCQPLLRRFCWNGDSWSSDSWHAWILRKAGMSSAAAVRMTDALGCDRGSCLGVIDIGSIQVTRLDPACHRLISLPVIGCALQAPSPCGLDQRCFLQGHLWILNIREQSPDARAVSRALVTMISMLTPFCDPIRHEPGDNTRCLGVVGSPCRDLNSRPLTYQGCALPLMYKGLCGWAGLYLYQLRQSQRIYSPPPLTTRAPTRHTAIIYQPMSRASLDTIRQHRFRGRCNCCCSMGPISICSGSGSPVCMGFRRSMRLSNNWNSVPPLPVCSWIVTRAILKVPL